MIERRAEYDPTRLLTRSAIAFVWMMIIFVGSIIVAQIVKSGEANTESWAALTGLIGWVTGTAGVVFNARFGISKQSEVKDKTIQKQAETAAVAQAALVTPAVTPAPLNPETGIIPAAEVAHQKGNDP